MTLLYSKDLSTHLESTHDYKVIGVVDLDWLDSQPRHILYQLFSQWHKSTYNSNERIVLFSHGKVSFQMLTHIQKCASLIDISNFFILICSPEISNTDFDLVRTQHSCDDRVFSSLQITLQDNLTYTEPNTNFELPDSFCFSPWAHLEIASNGEFKPCCVYKESITASNGIVYNINSHSVDEVYNSNYLKQLRQQFLSGNKPAGCQQCWYKEQHGGKSNRTWTTDHLGVRAHCLHIEQDQLSNLISLDIKMGNLCNFKCRICLPANSSRIAEERVKHFESSIDLKLLNQQGQWVENQKIWEMFETLGSQLVNIDFYGGEPFLIRQHEVFLDFLIEHDYAKNIRLHYNSNGSIYPTHLIDKWQWFRQVDIAFSIDNIGIRFELERGGNWREVEENLDSFLRSKLSNMILSVFSTVNVQNVYYLDQLILWFETKNFNALVWNLLEDPKYLSVMNMNQELTELVLKKLQTIDDDRLEKYNLNSIIELLKKQKYSSNSIDQLAEYMLKLDNVRNQKFHKTHSEIANIIYKGKNHGQTI
jgi:radical SAM protein with 4Fe4S-binding SPASM domain